jgi:DNA repair exonuclease SbcCD nuclease subunit
VVKFIHTADWQLGMTRHFLDTEAQARFSQARIESIRSIGRLATEHECSFVVVCGDVFETNYVDRQVVVRALDAMAETPDVDFYLLPGNHDPITASSVFKSQTFTSRKPANVHVLDSVGPYEVAEGVEIVAAPWTSKAPLEDLALKAIGSVPASDGIRIVVGHGAVDTLSPDTNDPSVIVQADAERAIADGRVQYVALGDRHSTTDVGTTGRFWYSGAPEPTAYREVDPGKVLVVEVDETEIAVETMRVAAWSFHSLEFDLRSSGDVDDVESALDAMEDKAVSIVQLELVGQLSLGEKVRLDAIIEHFSDLFASLTVWERHTDLVVLPDDDDFALLPLSGFARDALDELVEAASSDDDDDASIGQDALGLLYRFAGGAE